jgi:hypothetical protein
MKIVISKSVDPKWLKRRKKDKSKLVNYWSNIYPDDYARKMVAKNKLNNLKGG